MPGSVSGTRLVEAVRAAIGSIREDATVAFLRDRIATISPNERDKLLLALLEAVQDPSSLSTESERVFVARLVAASVPFTFSVLESALQYAVEDNGAEFQFSVFVALTDIHEVATAAQIARVLYCVQSFLSDVAVDRQQEAWMAGDLLGDHWRVDESLPALLLLATKARYPAGRRAALHGLSHAIERATKEQQWTIVATLKAAAENDESHTVRRAAISALTCLRDS